MDLVNINTFMDRFHAVERELRLFDSMVDGELWWDTVRFDTCYFLFDCLSGLTYSSAHRPPPRRRRLGTLRRSIRRQLLFARTQVNRKDLMVIRAPRTVVEGRLRDVALDPIIDLFASRSRTIDTLPQRFHLPDFEQSQWPAKVPQSLPDIVQTLLQTFGIDANRAAQLDELIRRGRAEYASQVAGYHKLLTRTRPKALLLVQNGIEKALFHVARMQGVPTVEMQHGLIGHGHPAYSYPRDVDYSAQTGLPDLFLTFSEFWQRNGYYPARRREVVGTDHFAAGLAPIQRALDAIMVISADIYHGELLDLTRQIAVRLPHRHLIYKLHPNQRADEPAIRSALSDLPNVELGDPLMPATRLMDNVSHLVAIQSTVVYEALQHGRRICIVPRHDYHIHSDIFDLPAVDVPESVEDMIAALETPASAAQTPTFFNRFDARRAFEILSMLIDGKAERS